jgi:inorganic pyrophosphatase
VLTYAVTEDYSSYESVDEEDVAAAPPEKPAKGKGKKKAAAPIVVKDEGGADEKVAKAPLKTAASTLKRKPSKPSVQKGGITSYFTKK